MIMCSQSMSMKPIEATKYACIMIIPYAFSYMQGTVYRAIDIINSMAAGVAIETMREQRHINVDTSSIVKILNIVPKLCLGSELTRVIYAMTHKSPLESMLGQDLASEDSTLTSLYIMCAAMIACIKCMHLVMDMNINMNKGTLSAALSGSTFGVLITEGQNTHRGITIVLYSTGCAALAQACAYMYNYARNAKHTHTNGAL